MPLPRSALASLAAITLLAGVTFFWRLGANPLEKWDEAIHAQVTHEMVASGNWLELTWNHEPYYRKPPLRFWLSAPVVMLFGESELTIRFWSAVAGVGTTLLLAWWAWQATKKIWPLWTAPLAFLSGKYLFYHAFRTGETDGLLTFFTVLALWSYWRSWAKPRWLLLTAVALGLTFLTKFTAAGFAGFTILLHLVLTRRFRAYPARLWWKALGLGALVVLPWIGSQLILRGSAFVAEYFGEDIATRTTENLYGFHAGPGWYWSVAWKRAFPLLTLGIPTLVWAALRAVRKRDDLHKLLLLFTLVTATALSITASKTDWYLLPLYPIVALIVGLWLPRVFRGAPRLVPTLLVAWATFAYVRRLPTVVPEDSALRWLNPAHYAAGLATETGKLGTALLALGVVLAVAWWGKRRPWAWRTALAGLVAWMGIVTLGGQRAELQLNRSETLLPEARALLQREKPDVLYLKNILLDHEPTVVFYLGNEANMRLEKASAIFPPGAWVLEKQQRDATPIPGTPLLTSPDFRLVRVQ